MITNADLTWYAKGVDAATRSEQWTRVVIRAVVWEDRKAANVLRSGNLEADRVAVYVPLARGLFNFQPDDVLVRGAVTDEITSSFTISDLRRKYRDTVTVRSVDKHDRGSLQLRHYQVGAS